MQINSLLDIFTLLLQYLQGYLANRGRVSGNVERKVEARVVVKKKLVSEVCL